MYRLATLLALLIALVAAGCDGSGDDSDSAQSDVAEAPESAGSDDASGSDSNGDAKKKKTDADEKSSDDGDENNAEDGDEPKTLREKQEEALVKLPSKQKSALIETVVRSSLLRFGLKLVDVELADGGRRVTAVVARKGVCNFVASQEPNLTLTVTHGLPGVKSVRYEVAGTGQELGYYVIRCKRPEIPSGAGRVVLEHRGVGGPYTSKRFTITNERWALEWVNEAASLAVIVKPLGGESKGEYFKPVGSQKRESDRYNYKGTGTFQIRAHGAGGWMIRVKEIR